MYTFLVSSAIETNRGIFSHEERLKQTLETFDSIRKNIPNVKIIIFEGGATLSNKTKEILNKECTLICLQDNKFIAELSGLKLNSHAEILGTYTMLTTYRNLIPHETKRIFKISGRYKLQDGFDITAYDAIDDKFVFAKKRDTWLSGQRQKELNIDGLFNTRLYSFTHNLIDYYTNCLKNCFRDLSLNLDFEHVIYKNIDKNLVIEFDKVYCEGRVAPNGSLEID